MTPLRFLPIALLVALVPAFVDAQACGWQTGLAKDVSGPQLMQRADMDLDGDPDIVFVQGFGLSWIENDGGLSGSWPVTSIVFDIVLDFEVVDMDGDGDLDVLAPRMTGSSIWSVEWYSNDNGDGSKWSKQSTGISLASKYLNCDVADINADGAQDLVLALTYSTLSQVLWFENLGGGTYSSPHVIPTTTIEAIDLLAEDLDGDGTTDVLSYHANGEVRKSYNMLGDGSAWLAESDSTASGSSGVGLFNSLATGDLDLDGKQDILIADSSDDSLYAWFNGSPGMTLLATGLSGAIGPGMADLDADGDVDLYACESDGDRIAWLEDRDGSSQSWRIWTVSTAADGIADLVHFDGDGDGDIDLFGAEADDDEIMWHENRLARGVQTPRLGSPPNPNVFLPGVTNRPSVGLTWDPVVDHSGWMTGAFVDVMLISVLPTNIPLPWGTLLCDPNTVLNTLAGQPFNVPFPNNGNFVGRMLYAQAASVDAFSVIGLTNGLDLVIGNY